MVADSKQYDLCGQVIGVDAQKPITVRYDGKVVGIFTAHLLANIP